MYSTDHLSANKSTASGNPGRAASPFFQPKLTVNTPGDAHEQEADAVADQVMRMREGDTPVVQRKSITPVVQRACAHCEAEKQKEEEGVQRKETGGSDAGGKAAPSIVNDVLSSGGGQSMDGGTRQFMESRFGQDFSSVRIHTGAQAAESASAIQARAYTSGRDVVFGAGEYQPGTESGKRLLAHELTHVGQQGGVKRAVQRAENDTNAANCNSLNDSMGQVNTHIRTAITNARTNAGSNTQAIPQLVSDQIGVNTSVGRSEIEDWAAGLGANAVNQPAQQSTRYRGVSYGIWRQPFFPILNPSMKINGICVGSDKLGHFAQQGFEYFSIANARGGTTARAEQYGRSTEAGGYGLQTTGVYSNADLEANRQGHRFYTDMAANPAGYSFDIANYINNNWNEQNNPNHYEQSVGETVWNNLLNGSWSGTMILNGQSKSIIAQLTLASGGTALSGTYGYMENGNPVNGSISGTITYNTNSLSAITGITISISVAQNGAYTGNFTNTNEDRLTGSLTGSTSTQTQAWDIRKSATTLRVPGAVQAPSSGQSQQGSRNASPMLRSPDGTWLDSEFRFHMGPGPKW